MFNNLELVFVSLVLHSDFQENHPSWYVYIPTLHCRIILYSIRVVLARAFQKKLLLAIFLNILVKREKKGHCEPERFLCESSTSKDYKSTIVLFDKKRNRGQCILSFKFSHSFFSPSPFSFISLYAQKRK